MRPFKRLRRKLDYVEAEHVEKIHRAYLAALEAHRGQKRRTGEPYISHPVAVACILADMKMDYQTIMAALLHDVIEDTAVEKHEIAAEFGDQVAELVDGVSKLTQIQFVSRAEAQAENFRKMVLAMARDIRVIIVKLADRLHNMRTLGSLHSLKRRRIARETLEIFAPLAKRLGMRDFSVELEELSFAAMYPVRYNVLKESVRLARGNRKKILSLIETRLTEGLSKSNLPSYTLAGREKHLYSIYRKMKTKHIPFGDIMDVYAFRIIVDDLDSCYRVLGIIHNLFKPVPERFKDYIAIPKANGYQSLHTTLFGPYGLPIEVQIRTTEMDRMATSGIAAHWLYKSLDHQLPDSRIRAEQWVKSLLEMQEKVVNPLEFIENVKIDLFRDEVYVFTPKGDIMELPAGATAVDFAYSVHTDIGNSCMAVKVDRRVAALSTPLVNGQTVEVMTSNISRPNPAWLDFVVTSKAKNSIRHFLKTQRRSESLSLGKQLLKQALLDRSYSLKKLPDTIKSRVVKEAHLKSFEELLESIGLGDRLPVIEAQRIVSIAKKLNAVPNDQLPESTGPMLICGTEGMMINLALCCCPLPGDPIVGVIDSGHGITVHWERCGQITRLRRYPGRVLPLRWADNAVGEFPSFVRAYIINEIGVLARITSAVANASSNIEDFKVEKREDLHYTIVMRITVKNRKHLADVMRHLRQIKHVIRLTRRLK